MPQCSDYGEGWAGEYPNCTYQTPGFTGSVESLGYGGLLPTDIEGRPYEDYFDPYDPTQQQMAETVAGTDVRQLQSTWALQQEQLSEAAALKTGQLGETWGLQKGQLGSGAGMGFREARRTGIGAKRKSGLAFSGTAEEMQRTAEADVMTKYRGGIRAGETAYQQALRTTETALQQALQTGELGLEQETTDIFQQLGQDVLGFQQDWQGGQQQTYFNLLGLGLDWGDDLDDTQVTQPGDAPGGSGSTLPYGISRGYQNWISTWDGTTQPPTSFGQYYPTIGNWTWNGTEYVQGG